MMRTSVIVIRIFIKLWGYFAASCGDKGMGQEGDEEFRPPED